MIDTILGIKKSPLHTSIASLSIELFPEFGWNIGNNQKAFGPGTLFQGNVVVKCKELSFRATSLRLVFQGVEAMLTYEMGPGVMRSHTSQLFSVRTVLWRKSDEQDILTPMKTYKFLFTVQMPMVQFPPSMNHDYYRCAFKLSAYLDPSLEFGEVPVMTQINLKYIPLTETRLLKTPVFLHDLKKNIGGSGSIWFSSGLLASVKLLSNEYVSGGNIQATICISKKVKDDNLRANSSPVHEDLSITLCLYQVSKFNMDAEPILNDLVATQSYVYRNIFVDNTPTRNRKEIDVSMRINESLPPSFHYSTIMSLSYKLKIKIHLKKSKIALDDLSLPSSLLELSNNDMCNKIRPIVTNEYPKESECANSKKKKFKKLLASPWSGSVSVFETPIVVGTMESGLRNSDELKEYSYFHGDIIDQMPCPRFIKNVEYEDALPKYEACTLPLYGDSSSRRFHTSCSIRSSGSSVISSIIMTTATPSSINCLRSAI